MKKPIAIVFSDLHINNWSRFNEDKKEPWNNSGFFPFWVKRVRNIMYQFYSVGIFSINQKQWTKS